ncbi:tryptophan synthase subunit alpha : Tryptophan synthase alpha chain OS=Blastopirellula marina DSM 3645 GN=trpA PE=3 SV=1: Trp_syntA [Gemmata massiliana]|uniref:Tryptophan synthase alpha chain n=1 Tax=Gemmata massiliana TaxID=1210884 RepID=A0A6P2CRP9_9BACT|nr:tryptophan synthase subunit alpha [Gemmata massiliana]VTR91257.1 tryptophan synthase subunit alpha : Tryptophan synthase alpha chain OS=Blastopirellula marina DSM 3645 GN=trpA PE=3 SV=1: Trp_syntA [Gemmata massiliana]
MNPIDSLFQRLRAAKRAAFMPFVTAGDPDIAFTRELLPAVADAGADLMEIGFPFSDPIADGPVIQASYTRALAQKLKLADVFAALRDTTARPGWSAPLVSMASYSLMFKMGPAAFIDAAKAAGVSGAVVPDVPVEEAEELSKLAADRDFKLVLLVTPTTSPQRAEKVVKACGGFVYVVSVVGITGAREALPSALREQLTRLRTMTELPLCVGFGVSRPEHVRELKEIADGVIVGSAVVKKLEAAGTDRAKGLADVKQLVSELRGALG